MAPSRYSQNPAERVAANWADQQKIAYEEGRLASHKIEALDATPGWTWERETYSFSDSIENWKAHHKKNGHAPSLSSSSAEERRAALFHREMCELYNKPSRGGKIFCPVICDSISKVKGEDI